MSGALILCVLNEAVVFSRCARATMTENLDESERLYNDENAIETHHDAYVELLITVGGVLEAKQRSQQSDYNQVLQRLFKGQTHLLRYSVPSRLS